MTQVELDNNTVSISVMVTGATVKEAVAKLVAAVVVAEGAQTPVPEQPASAGVSPVPPTPTPENKPRRGRPPKAEQEAKKKTSVNSATNDTGGSGSSAAPAAGSTPAPAAAAPTADATQITADIVNRALQDLMNSHPEGMDAGMKQVFALLAEYKDDAGSKVKKVSSLQKTDYATVLERAKAATDVNKAAKK